MFQIRSLVISAAKRMPSTTLCTVIWGGTAWRNPLFTVNTTSVRTRRTLSTIWGGTTQSNTVGIVVNEIIKLLTGFCVLFVPSSGKFARNFRVIFHFCRGGRELFVEPGREVRVQKVPQLVHENHKLATPSEVRMRHSTAVRMSDLSKNVCVQIQDETALFLGARQNCFVNEKYSYCCDFCVVFLLIKVQHPKMVNFALIHCCHIWYPSGIIQLNVKWTFGRAENISFWLLVTQLLWQLPQFSLDV